MKHHFHQHNICLANVLWKNPTSLVFFKTKHSLPQTQLSSMAPPATLVIEASFHESNFYLASIICINITVSLSIQILLRENLRINATSIIMRESLALIQFQFQLNVFINAIFISHEGFSLIQILVRNNSLNILTSISASNYFITTRLQ